MKRKIVAIPLLAATLVFIIAYTTIERGSADKTIVSAKVQEKLTVAKKIKTQKKKTKFKPTAARQTQKEDAPEEVETKEQEEQVSTSPQNIAIRNVILKNGMEYSAKNNLFAHFTQILL